MASPEDLEKNFIAFSSLVPKLIYQKRWQQKIELHRAFSIWEKVIGAEMRPHTRPFVIHGRTLWVEVSDSIRMQQLNFMKYDLLLKINGMLRPQSLEDIRFRQNPLVNRVKETPVVSEKKPVDPEKKRQFEQLLGGVRDEGCRNALDKLWTAFAINKK